jgi:hypothetical protein
MMLWATESPLLSEPDQPVVRILPKLPRYGVMRSGNSVLGISSRFDDGSTLALFMLWILTNDANFTFALDDLALLAHRLYRRSYLHVNPPFLIAVANRVPMRYFQTDPAFFMGQ